MADFRSGKPRARVGFSGVAVHPGGLNLVEYDQAVFTDACHFSGVGSLHPDRAGLYAISAQVGFQTIASGSRTRLYVQVNNVSVQGAEAISTAGPLSIAVVTDIELQANDQVTVICTRHPTLSAGIEPVQSFLTLTRVGPVRWT